LQRGFVEIGKYYPCAFLVKFFGECLADSACGARNYCDFSY
jgi:hypothetical protein